MTTQHEITRLLADWSNGDRQALEKLTPAITTLARAEGLEAHARSVEVRVNA